jgi:transmembrane sensor
MDSHREIEDHAAALLARRDSGDWTDADQAHLEEWMAGSTARRVAVLRLEAGWENARRLRALGAGLPRGTLPLAGELQSSLFFSGSLSTSVEINETRGSEKGDDSPGPHERGAGGRLRGPWVRLAAAASVLIAVGVGTYFAIAPTGERYATPIGGIASVPLQDGSSVTLNTASEVRVELTPNERHIRLDKGEAFFEVASDRSRPFIVEVGSKRVIAVGTKFSVRREGDDIRVAVTEGKVEVTDTRGSAAVAHNREKQDPQSPASVGGEDPGSGSLHEGEVFLTPGHIASADDAGILVEDRPLAEVVDDLSWRQGYLTFHETSLADAVAEFNRYNAHQIAVADPKVAAIRISGTFRAVNYRAFIQVLDAGFAIHANTNQDTTTLTKD